MADLFSIMPFLVSLYSEIAMAMTCTKNAVHKVWTAFQNLGSWTVYADQAGAFLIGAILVLHLMQ